MSRNSNLALKIVTTEQEAWGPGRADAATVESLRNHQASICVMGLGYVGLPLATHLAKYFSVVGFDINASRIKELNSGRDSTGETQDPALLKQKSIRFTKDASQLDKCKIFVVAVPTPVDQFNVPDLSPLVSVSKAVGKILKKGMTVVFESTVYPGVTEEVCGKIIEEVSGLKLNTDFFLGYSPERINPGDTVHTVDKMTKVVSGSTPEVSDLLCWIYGKVTQGKIHQAPSLKVAEACKITENIQRDVNIALMNELAVIFNSIGIQTTDVLQAARTKWNFLNFYPGLVGGHCIGVDPYYMTHLAQRLKTPASLIAISRSVNESIPRFLAQRTISEIFKTGDLKMQTPIKIAILGAAFKENVPDTRNTKVNDLAVELERFGCEVHIVDQCADAETFSHEYGRELGSFESLPKCHAIIIAVRHDEFVKQFSPEKLKLKLSAPYVVLDFKEMLDKTKAEELGLKVVRI